MKKLKKIQTKKNYDEENYYQFFFIIFCKYI